MVINLPTPKFDVKLIEENNKHFYDVTNGAVTQRLPGVTGFQDIVGGGKFHALLAWSKREALAVCERALRAKLDGKDSKKIVLNDAWITSVLDAAKKRPKAIKEAAASLGTRAHKAIDDIVNGRKPIITEDIMPAVLNFEAWIRQSGIKIIAGDTKVASLKYGFGGSIDALGKDSAGQYVLIDFKTSNAIRKEYALQLAAYERGLNHTYDILVPRAICVRFGKEDVNDFEAVELNSTDLNHAFDAFKACQLLTYYLAQDRFSASTKMSCPVFENVKTGGEVSGGMK